MHPDPETCLCCGYELDEMMVGSEYCDRCAYYGCFPDRPRCGS